MLGNRGRAGFMAAPVVPVAVAKATKFSFVKD